MEPEDTRASQFERLGHESPNRERAWREFEEKYAPIIRRFALRMGADMSDAEDIVQDVFVGFVGALPRFKYDPDVGRFRSYLKTSAFRAWRARRDKSVRTVSIETAPEDALLEWNEAHKDHSSNRALRKLQDESERSPERRCAYEAFRLTAIVGLSVDEVSTQLNMSEANVHKARSRMKKRLERILEKFDEMDL